MAVNIDTRETVGVETAGGTVALALHGRSVLSLHVRGDGAADYALDVRDSVGGEWVQGVATYSASADYDDVTRTGAAEARLRCTTGTGTADDAADVLLSAGGT